MLKKEPMPALTGNAVKADNSDREPKPNASSNPASEPSSTCLVCVKAKQQRHYMHKPVERTSVPFQLVHSKLCGPITQISFAGAGDFILYIDDYSRTA